jgi:hypothetical protein
LCNPWHKPRQAFLSGIYLISGQSESGDVDRFQKQIEKKNQQVLLCFSLGDFFNNRSFFLFRSSNAGTTLVRLTGKQKGCCCKCDAEGDCFFHGLRGFKG